jgi:hypothetical protein
VVDEVAKRCTLADPFGRSNNPAIGQSIDPSPTPKLLNS